MQFHKNIRLPGHDYTRGTYFVTLCTHSRAQVFGEITGRGASARIELTHIGQIIDECWRAIPDHFPHVRLDEIQMMPDHIHAILILQHDHSHDPIRSTRWVDATAQVDNSNNKPNGPQRGSLGAIIAAFKSETTKRVNRLNNTMGQRLWQQGFFERIIRQEGGEYARIAKYIAENPQNWG